jgi:hypothetical protein
VAQGVFPPKTFATYALPGHWYGVLEWQYPPHQRQGSYEEEGRAVNTMKVGMADASYGIAMLYSTCDNGRMQPAWWHAQPKPPKIAGA